VHAERIKYLFVDKWSELPTASGHVRNQISNNYYCDEHGLLENLVAVPFGIACLIGLLGVAIVYSYTSYLKRVGFGELGCVIGFALWSIGPYFVLTGRYTLSILSVSLVSGLMGVALLILNEFPDLEADRAGGRRNIPIMLGLKGASKIYSLVVASAYVWLLVLVIARILPVFALLAFITLPMRVRVITLVLRDYEPETDEGIGAECIVRYGHRESIAGLLCPYSQPDHFPESIVNHGR